MEGLDDLELPPPPPPDDDAGVHPQPPPPPPGDEAEQQVRMLRAELAAMQGELDTASHRTTVLEDTVGSLEALVVQLQLEIQQLQFERSSRSVANSSAESSNDSSAGDAGSFQVLSQNEADAREWELSGFFLWAANGADLRGAGLESVLYTYNFAVSRLYREYNELYSPC